MQTIYKNILPSLLSLLLLLAPSSAFAQEPESVDQLDSDIKDLQITLLPAWTGQSNPVTCTANLLTGPATVHRFEPDQVDVEAGEEARIPTELVRLELQGTANCPDLGVSVPITIRESPFKVSPGGIFATAGTPSDPVVNSSNPADSFFDVFVEIETDLSTLNMGTRTLFGKKPIRVRTQIEGLPPLEVNGDFPVGGYGSVGHLENADDAGDRNASILTTSLDLFEPGSFGIPDFSDTPMDPHAQLDPDGHPTHTPIDTKSDESPPICRLSEIVLSDHINVIAHDPETGIETLQCNTRNATASCGFTQGTKQEVPLSATKDDPNKSAMLSVWITDGNGNTTHCDPVVTRLAAAVPEGFSLEQNYPNPVNPTTTIPFKVAEKRLVTLTVYDVLGREVTTLIDREVQPGSYEVQWDASGLSSGIYIYQFEAGAYSETKEMTLVK